MTNLNERYYKNTKTKLLLFSFVFGLICICGYLCMLYLSTYTWFGTELYYPFLHFMKKHMWSILSINFFIGFFIILWCDYKKMKNLVDEEKKDAQKRAEQSEKRKNDLVMYLAHDLKTPLTSVLGYTDLLQNAPELSEVTRQKYMGVVKSKAERMEELLDEFFEITRYNLTQITLVKTRINLTRMLEQLVFEFRPMFLERNLTCECDAEQDIYFFCDADRIQRVFDNLLKNAVHYAFVGTAILITMKRAGRMLEVTFENEGNTISEQNLEKIFEQFFRLDSARGTKGGTGVGLAIAKEIVELHGGHIKAFSEDNHVRFVVTMPYADDFSGSKEQS